MKGLPQCPKVGKGWVTLTIRGFLLMAGQAFLQGLIFRMHRVHAVLLFSNGPPSPQTTGLTGKPNHRRRTQSQVLSCSLQGLQSSRVAWKGSIGSNSRNPRPTPKLKVRSALRCAGCHTTQGARLTLPPTRQPESTRARRRGLWATHSRLRSGHPCPERRLRGSGAPRPRVTRAGRLQRESE